MAERFTTTHADMICTAVKNAYANGVLAVYGGASQPADANDAETGTLLALITVNGGAFTPGVATNGLNFDAPSAGVLSKAAAETWSGVGLAAAGTGTTATYFRFYDNSQDTGASPTGLRFDGAIGTSSLSELQMTVTTIVEGSPVVINSFTYSPPRA